MIDIGNYSERMENWNPLENYDNYIIIKLLEFHHSVSCFLFPGWSGLKCCQSVFLVMIVYFGGGAP